MTTYSIDIGYGYTKGLNCSRETIFPSVVGHAQKIERIDEVLNGKLLEDGIKIEINQRELFVGELAQVQSGQLAWTPQSRERDDSTLLALTYAALLKLKAKRNLNLVTGLPVRWYSQDRDRLEALLQNTHYIRQIGGKETPIHIDQAKILPQPAGTYFDQILTLEGKLKDPTAKAGKQAVIDIGQNTVDYLLMDKLDFVASGSSSLDRAGLAVVHEALISEVEQRLDQKVSMHQADEILRAGSIRDRGRQVSVAGWIEAVIESASQVIASEAGRLWGNGRQLDKIYISGGGASVIGPYLAQTYPHLTILDNSQMANVQGYQKYGKALWATKRPKA